MASKSKVKRERAARSLRGSVGPMLIMRAWVAKDETPIFDSCTTLLFFKRKPRLRNGMWTGGLGGRWPIPGSAFINLRPGQIREIIVRPNPKSDRRGDAP